MPDESLIKLKYETYLKMIENSEGTKLFNSAFVKRKDTGEVFDVLRDGEFSCAFFVSGLLSILDIIDTPHSTVTTLGKKLLDLGFMVVDKPAPGDILIWEKIAFEDGTQNEHVGFFLDENRAYSTSWKDKSVVCHHPTYGVNTDGSPVRKIQTIFRNSNF